MKNFLESSDNLSKLMILIIIDNDQPRKLAKASIVE